MVGVQVNKLTNTMEEFEPLVIWQGSTLVFNVPLNADVNEDGGKVRPFCFMPRNAKRFNELLGRGHIVRVRSPKLRFRLMGSEKR